MVGRLVGAHVPSADPLGEAAARGADLVQIFLSAPRAWKPPKPRADADQLRAAGLAIYVHTPYLLNLATSSPRIRDASRTALQQACDAAATIGARGVVVHGGHVGDQDPAAGRDNWRAALERLSTDVPVLVENTAGGTNAMARHVDAVDALWEALAGVDVPLGFCLDTCHLHAAGEDLLAATERLAGIVDGIDLVHGNDSKDPAGSGRDRHENLGQGLIDPDLLIACIQRAGAPVVVETPGGADAQAADITWLRERL